MIKNITITVLVIALAICLYFILNSEAPSRSQNFVTAYENKVAKERIKAYRDMWSGSIYKKTKIITFTKQEILDYLNGQFADLTSGPKMDLKDDYHWVVGFYMKREDNEEGDPRNSFYVIPTMQKNDNTDYIDYFDNTEDYNDRTDTPLDNQKSAYNAGHLWP